MTREKIKNLIKKAINKAQQEKKLAKFKIPEILVEKPEDKTHGDYSTNIALQIAKSAKKSPMEIAELIINSSSHLVAKPVFSKIEAREPGFINFFLSEAYLQKQVSEILKRKEKYGQLKIGKNQKVNVEFISANPTGPLHVGNARGGFCGDVLANVLDKAGYKAKREYYINDIGRQIEILKNSLTGRKPSYENSYIDELKKKGEKDVRRAINFIVEEIKQTVKEMGIEFDKWFYESDLYKEKEKDKIINFLKKKNLIDEKEDAIWFKSTEFGDDKDRVLIRANNKGTYLLSDIAYLKNKFKRGFDYLIIFLGAEHHGYIGRLKAAAEAIGYDKDKVKPIIMQLVKLFEKGKEVRMSKRTGIYVTIDELMKEVGRDAARFFFLTRNYGSHLIFDLDLAKEQSNKNPVYYVQYAHARICAILRKYEKDEVPQHQSRARCGAQRSMKKRNIKFSEFQTQDLRLLNHPSELNLIKELIRFPEIIEDCAKDYQVQRVPQYAIDLATSFHQFYRDCRVISENKELTEARLDLVLATKNVLKNTLDLMGISSPEKM